MSLSPWVSVLLAVPVLLLGELLSEKVSFFRRFNIPDPVVGGLLVSFLVLGLNLIGAGPLSFASAVTAPWWTWIVTIEPEWSHAPKMDVTVPLMVGFFTCIGLNATWDLVRRGGHKVLLFLILATVFALLQNGLGVILAKMLGQNPLLGLVCGSLTLTGGHGTAIGFAPLLEKLGLSSAALLGAAAATIGVVAGGLIGGPVGTALIRRNQLHAEDGVAGGSTSSSAGAPRGILAEVRELGDYSWETLRHFLLVLACIKAGAWVSHYLQLTGATFPPQMGAMIIGVLIRNLLDATGHRWIRYEIIDLIAAILLALFLTIAMMRLNLMDLASAAVPMLVILAVQIAFMALFAYFVTYRVMGRDYDAAVMAGGHCGFGLGATSNAMATMKVLVARHGAAPGAFLVIPLVGAILIDFTNALNITLFLNFLK